MKTILVTGASGLVGSRFTELTSSKYTILSPNQEELDITSKESVENYFNNHSEINTVVNFAAYTNVDGAEKERGDENGICWKINVIGARNIAEASKKYDKFLIHISTDFIFTGTSDNPGPYPEDEKLAENMEGISWYGWTKLMAEREISKIDGKFAIVRIAYPFRANPYEAKLDFARNNLKLFEEGKLYPLFSDQIFTPVLIDDLVFALEKIIEMEKSGIYHVVTADTTTPYDFTNYLLEKVKGAKDAVRKGSMEEFLKTSGRTPRPRLGGLKTEETQKVLGMKFKTWKEMVDEFVSQLSTS